MKNSIETVWKEGFLHEKSLVAPKINDLYNQKSIHLIDRMKRLFRANVMAIVIMALLIPLVHYFLDALWLGLAASTLLLLTAWYSKRQMQEIKDLNQGATSFDYLKSFDRWLKDSLAKNQKVVRYSYPVYFLIACGTIGSAWIREPELTQKVQQQFPGLTFVGSYPLIGLILVGLITLLMVYFSDKIYQWDVRLVYGRIFKKLEETISEMEQLR
ncbi:hypothetical protein [Cyclobacterium jeungdonense]|uniref:Uncharacterized protein n=1 Tax=Cyclobacterium jeungdonense TaxID=708087 RepID=A0ABT8C9A4_9BACT|nr:hypothetical protein [Cyclobacterium jeungdonense]MDN3688350.1 hypothetical protein [Cyclobacterium jeungdonense]